MMSSIDKTPTVQPGTYRFVVGSTAEAVATIREKLGPDARVLSVRNDERAGLGRWFGSPRFEVIAEVAAPAAPSTFVAESDEPAEPELPATTIPPAASARAEANDVVDRLLRRAGFPEKMILQLNPPSRRASNAALPLHRVLADLGRDLRVAAARPPVNLPSRTAFFGGSGVGRTTALCKWLAHRTITEGRQGAVWRVEFERPNAAPLLDVFAEALNVTVDHYAEGMLQPPESADYLLVDLPALPKPDSTEAASLREFLDRENIGGRVLVLNALYEPDALRAAYARGRAFGATHIVFTHLDELARWGRLWEFLWGGELAPLFVSTGPGLIGDFTIDVLDAVLKRTVPSSGGEGTA